MAIDIVRFQTDASFAWGVLAGPAPTMPDDLVEIRRIAPDAKTTGDLIAAIEAGAVPGEAHKIKARSLLSPVTSDGQLICQGLNYRDHAAEAGHYARKENLIFFKASSSLTGPYADIVKPAGVDLLDYEIEIGIVMRQTLTEATTITKDNIGDVVAGVTLCNDVSARDVMFGAAFMQWFRGKSFRGFCPTGPVLRLLKRDEVAATLTALSITLDMNGERRQEATSANFIHTPADTITELSALMDLRRGDMILTGTPGGVIAQGSPTIMAILKDHLLDDATRRAMMTAEMQGAAKFLAPGDTMKLNLRDEHAGVGLGSQYSRIV